MPLGQRPGPAHTFVAHTGAAAATALRTASGRAAVRRAARKPLQLDELQPQRLDARDEAVECGTVGHLTHQQGLGRRCARLERIERPQQPGRQPAGDPKGVLSAHVAPPSGGASRCCHGRSNRVRASPPPSMRDGDRRPPALDGTGFLDPRFAVPLATHVVVRPRLHAQLTAGLAAPCVLIAAPAGWGKTLLASSWLGADGARGTAAWISLGPAEDDLRAFWTSVASALVPVVGDRAAGDAAQRRRRRRPGAGAGAVRRGAGRRRDAGRPRPRQPARDHRARRAREPAAAGPAPAARSPVRDHDPPGPAVAAEPAAPRRCAHRDPGVRPRLPGGRDPRPARPARDRPRRRARRPARRADRGVGRRAAAGRPGAAGHGGPRPASSTRSPATTTPWPRTCWTR